MEQLEKEFTQLFQRFLKERKIGIGLKELSIKIIRSKNTEFGKYCTPSLIKYQSGVTKNQEEVNIPAQFKLYLDKHIAEENGKQPTSKEIQRIENLTQKNGYLSFNLKVDVDQGEEIKVKESQVIKEDCFQFRSLGVFKSCFKEKFGTPKQSGLLTNARSSLSLASHVHPSILEGLEEYSHLWVIFVFHAELSGPGKAYSEQKGKVAPPKLEGAKVGIFATRSPHRPNPIGLSLAKLERVDHKQKILFFSGLDLIQGTPILDLKPYHPADSLNDFKIPNWLEQAEKHLDSLQVEFPKLVDIKMKEIAGKGLLQFYNKANIQELVQLVKNCLSLNPHSTHTKKKFLQSQEESKEASFLYGLRLDNLVITYKVEGGVVTVMDVEVNGSEKIRTEKWLKKKREEVLKLKELKSCIFVSLSPSCVSKQIIVVVHCNFPS